MAVTREELRDFTRFADAKLANGGASSLSELVAEWEAQHREMEETVADIRQSHEDIAAGHVASVTETFADVRKQLGLDRG